MEGTVDVGEPTSCLDHVYLGCTQRACKPNETVTEEYRKDIRITSAQRDCKPNLKIAQESTDLLESVISAGTIKTVTWL